MSSDREEALHAFDIADAMLEESDRPMDGVRTAEGG